MTNTKTRKSGKASAKSRLTNSTDIEGVDELDVAGRNWFQLRSGGNMLSDDTEVDDDDCINDSDTGTSFSLEECMNEFRARRNRRTYSHTRQEVDRDRDENKYHDFTEKDLINQNLCNKEQERQCKPCKDGFCYCFTSDSGDGAGSVVNLAACRALRAGQVRQSRRYRRSECGKAGENDQQHHAAADEKISSKSVANNEGFQKTTYAVQNQLTASCRLEFSHMDAPLIHIIQELRNNCVISEVKINKEKLQKNQFFYCGKSKRDSKLNSLDNIQQTSGSMIQIESPKPTAPAWESVAELDTQQRNCLWSQLENSSGKSTEHSKRRNMAGGRLLQKRLSSSNFSYNPPDTKEPPPKPPRGSLGFEEYSAASMTSTPSSIREAERVLDEFLADKGYTVPTICKNKLQERIYKHPMNTQPASKKCISKKEIWSIKNKNPDTMNGPLSSRRDIENVIDQKKTSHDEGNISKLLESQSKPHRIGWNDPRINYMLSYDSKDIRKSSQASEAVAESQKCTEVNALRQERIGWQIPPRIDIDTVDGEVHLNLASNVENKDTPVKSELPARKTSKRDLQPQRVLWSEQLRNLSPWSNKQKTRSQTEIPKKNIRLSSKAFLNSSRKKILRLVSPKKENKEHGKFQQRKTSNRHVAVQTSHDSFNHHQCPQSPPGSYHSPVQLSQLLSHSFDQQHSIIADGGNPGKQHFNSSRVINSKKAVRPSQRKLNFPLNCAGACFDSGNVTSPLLTEMKTYRSFNEELDQDISLSKMSYILSNIRAKLEARDNLAVQTFRETGRNGIDCIEGRKNIHCSANERVEHHGDPIYSEIDEDSVHISESANFDNHTGIHKLTVDHKPEVVYARVNKCKKQVNNNVHYLPVKSTALGKILHDSIKATRTMTKTPYLPPLPEPPGGESAVYSSGTTLCKQQSHCQSLNNVRVMENYSLPKRHRNLSKSDISLHRNDIFLENLCKSELLLTNFGCNSRLQKIENNHPKYSQRSMNHTIPTIEPYDVPIDYMYDANDSIRMESTPPRSNSCLSVIDPPLNDNQSTPKKPSFTTKDEYKDKQICADPTPGDRDEFTRYLNISCSYPLNKHQECDLNRRNESPHCHSLSEGFRYRKTMKEVQPFNTLPGLKTMRFALRKSFRKGKQFIKMESKRLSRSLNFTGVSSESVNLKNNTKGLGELIFESSFDLPSLFSLNQSATVDEQLTKVVHICRKLPDLENSSEMVEAERLLLFSKLHREKQERTNPTQYQIMTQSSILHFFIDDIFLPVRTDVNFDIFFNYFYIVTFECDGVIRSTQSAECQNSVVVFRDCGIEFSVRCQHEMSYEDQSIVRCKIFMLRLRKVSTLSFEPTKKKRPESAKRTSFSSTSSSLPDEIVSRFRLHASFTLDASSFIPYEYVEQESKNADRICLRASSVCNVLLMSHTNPSNLSLQMQLKGRAEVRFPKRSYRGFLNVEDPFTQHNWNRRWCTLDGLVLNIWHDVNNLHEEPLLSLNLRDCQSHTLYPASLDLCARPRSFRLDATISKTNVVSAVEIYFAAETQEDLSTWLENLNFTLDFIRRWLIPP